MAYTVKKVDVWVGDIMNRPGTLARVLESLRNAGAQLEFMIARRVSDTTSRVFVAPLKGAKQKQAAADVGLVPAAKMHCLRIDGADKPGLAAAVARALGDNGVNIRGSSAAAIGKKVVLYFAFSDEADLKRATSVIKKALK